eukprot:247703_1
MAAPSTVNTSYFWLIVAIGTYGFGAFVTGILFLIELYHGIRIRFRLKSKINKYKPQLKRKRRTSTTSMWIVTLLSIFGFCATCGVAVTSKLTAISHILPHIICHHMTKSASFIYMVSKCLMYLLFVLRIYTVYKDTQYEYKSRFVITIASISTLLTSLCLIFMQFFGDNGFVNVINTTYKNCIISFPLWLTAFAAFNDIMNQSFLIYLFIKPLIALQKNARNQDSLRANSRQSFRKLSLKYYILGLTACISTLLFLLTVPTLGTTFFAGIDCIVNSFCLLFCFHHWDKQYL